MSDTKSQESINWGKNGNFDLWYGFYITMNVFWMGEEILNQTS